MAVVTSNSKVFEKPESGDYIGIIADVVHFSKDLPKFQKKNVSMIRVVWVLNQNDSEGVPFRVVKEVTSSVHEKAKFYALVKDIMGTAPPAVFESEELIGRMNRLVVERETGKDNKVYANVKAILRMPPAGTAFVPPVIPPGFVRNKDRKDNNYGSQSTATSTPVAQAQPAPQSAPQAVPQSAPQSDAPIAF